MMQNSEVKSGSEGLCHNATEAQNSAHISYTVLFAFGGRSQKAVQNLCLSRLFTVYIML